MKKELCNINQKEINLRRAASGISFVITLLILILSIVNREFNIYYVFFYFIFSFFGFLNLYQANQKFCAAYGLMNIDALNENITKVKFELKRLLKSLKLILYALLSSAGMSVLLFI